MLLIFDKTIPLKALVVEAVCAFNLCFFRYLQVFSSGFNLGEYGGIK